jgi:excinuclease ABC subunit C
MLPKHVKLLTGKELPETPGVYIYHDAAGKILYVGKAANLRRRVESYFTRPHDARIQKLVDEIREIELRHTDTAIEALILESELIKKLEPPFNIREKDDTSFLYVVITKDIFPRVLVMRGKDLPNIAITKKFGPFTSSSSAREAYRIVRRIFPFNTHAALLGKTSAANHKPTKLCFDAQIGLCPGVCAGGITKQEYRRTIKHIILFFEGKKERIINALEREMEKAAKKTDFEQAERLRRQLFALRHIQDVALINDTAIHSDAPKFRIEGYDISNISGTSSVGSMVVFTNGRPDKAQYRKFKIKSVKGANDVASLQEVLARRLRNEWPLPDLFLIDGGLPQVHAAEQILRGADVKIPIIGLAKGPERKRNDVIGAIPEGTDLATLIKVRDEAHRFAITYHRALRKARFLI